MTQQHEPVRWIDEPDGLPRSFIEGLARYPQQGPSDEQLARMRNQLATAAGDRAASTSGLRHLARSRGVKGLLGLVLGSLLGVWALRSPIPTSEPAQAPIDVRAQEVREAAAEARGPQVADADAPPVSEPPPESEAASAPGKAPRRSSQAAKALPSAPSVDPAAELSLLTRARRLMSASPEQALELTREHAASYPAGVFVEERELIAIEALAHAKRADEALARGRSFLAAHPRSAHGERVRVILQGLTQAPRDGL